MKKITMKEIVDKASASGEKMKEKLQNETFTKEFSSKMKTAVDKTKETIKESSTKVKSTAIKTKDAIKKNSLNKTKVTESTEVAQDQPKQKLKQTKRHTKVKDTPRVIKENKKYTFAILTKDITNPRSRKIMKAIQSVLYDYDCTFTVCAAEGNASIEEKYVQAFISQQVDALIVETCGNASGIAKMMKDAQIPCVFLHTHGKGLTSLAVDEVHAGEIIGAYAMEKKHLIIRYLGADEALSSAHYEGMKNVYHEHKQPLDYTIKMSDGSHIDTYETLKEIFEEKIDLLLLERDEMAIPLNKFLKEYHIAVPQNTSVISYGGHAITQVMSPTLTSIAFDYNAYAQFVCETLFATIEKTTKPKMPMIYHIQEGDSVR